MRAGAAAPAGAFANDVIVVPIGGIPCCNDENEVWWLRSVRLVLERVSDEVLFRESMDVAGETPSER